MTSTATLHYRRAELGPGTTAACGTITSKLTAEATEVTCKRCLKTIETGSAESGYLAGSKLNEEARAVLNEHPTFESLLAQMADLTWVPLDAREQFDAMLRENFTGSIND